MVVTRYRTRPREVEAVHPRNDPNRCPKCKGEGEFVSNPDTAGTIHRDGSYSGSRWRDCEDCYGTGLVEAQ